MTTNNITLDELARMVAKGFEDTDKNTGEFRNEVMGKFHDMNNRFNTIEDLLHHEYRNRIEKLEDQIKELQSDYRQLVGFKK